MEVVDLFCGIGGLTRGLLNSGLEVKAGFDFDKTCAYAYETNNGIQFVEKDIRDTKGEDIVKYYSADSVKVLVGCAPCQSFSRMRVKLGNETNSNDEKFDLLLEFARLIEEVSPDIISMENVPNIQKTSVFERFLHILESKGYFIDYKVVYCPDYGIPQHRRRFVFLASKLGEIKILPKTHDRKKIQVKDFISNLPEIQAGEVSTIDQLHQSASLNDINIKRLKASKPGGTWKDWPFELRANCHKKETGKTYTSVYSRMSWDKIGPTITTQFYCFGSGRFGHPEQNRALSLREGTLLQTFPENYNFIDPTKKFIFRDIARHIGNAVPVRLGEIIDESIKMHMEIIKND